MADVVELKPQPNPQIVAQLEEALELARAGKVIGFAAVLVLPDGSQRHCQVRSYQCGYPELVAGVSRLQYLLNKDWEDV